MFLVCMLGALLVLRTRPSWETVVLGFAPLAILTPWLHQLQRGLDYDQATNIAPLFPASSPVLVRDVSVALFFGQHRANASAGGADPAIRGDRGATRVGHAVRRTPPQGGA